MAVKDYSRLAGKMHHRFGAMRPEKIPGTVFDPLPLFYDPAFFRDLLAYFRGRAARAGVGAGLTKAQRAAALDEAAQRGIRRFIDRDYQKAGLTADDVVPAILSTARYMDRGAWREGSGNRRVSKARALGDSVLFNRAQAARAGLSPATIFATGRGSAEDTAALVGYGCDDVPGKPTAVPGGPSGRGLTDGRIVRVETIVRDRIVAETGDDGTRRRFQETTTATGWKMERGRGRAETLQPCTVDAGRPAPLARFIRGPMPAAVPATPGDGTEWRSTDPAWLDATTDAERAGRVRHYVRAEG
jgi:hypothetical protein